MFGAGICNWFFWSFFRVSSESQKFFHTHKMVKYAARRLIQTTDRCNASQVVLSLF